MEIESLKHLRAGGRVRIEEGKEFLLPASPASPTLVDLISQGWITPKSFTEDRLNNISTESLEILSDISGQPQASGKNMVFRTIAESISISSDPHEAAIRSFARREHNRYANEKTYHFEDGSYLVFKVSYAVQRSGVSK